MRGSESDADLTLDRTGYDPITETYHVRHDWESDDSLASTITTVVEVVTDSEISDLAPLYESVDPDELERLLRSLQTPGDRVAGTVRFQFAGLPVVARSDGHVYVHCDPDDVPEW